MWIILVLDLEKNISEILKFLTFNFLQHKFQEFGDGGGARGGEGSLK